MKIKCKKFSQRARTPTQGTSGLVGFDLSSVEDKMIDPCSSVLIRTDVGFQISCGYFGKIHARSSYSLQFTGVSGGVIDSDYRRDIIVIFFDFSLNWTQIHEGDKIVQIVFQRKANNISIVVVKDSNNTASRGNKGFGSTGKDVQEKCRTVCSSLRFTRS